MKGLTLLHDVSKIKIISILKRPFSANNVALYVYFPFFPMLCCVHESLTFPHSQIDKYSHVYVSVLFHLMNIYSLFSRRRIILDI